MRPAEAATADAPRRKGRPTGPEGGVGRHALTQAARELLRVTPPAKITREKIARHAGVNPALIRYYFGDKDHLLTAVVEEISRENLARLKEIVARPISTEEKLRLRVHLILEMHTENPYYHQLIFEQLWHGGSAAQKKLGHDMVAPYIVEVRQLIEEGQRAKEFRDVDPRFVHVAALSLCELFINAPYVLKELFGVDEVGPDLIRSYGDFVADLLIQGIGSRQRLG